MMLPAGAYTLALTQFDNTHAGLSLADGFVGGGTTNFGGRESYWGIDFLGIASVQSIDFNPALTPVPVPPALLLIGSGLFAMLRGSRRREDVASGATKGLVAAVDTRSTATG
jgi:hypothetical protein